MSKTLKTPRSSKRAIRRRRIESGLPVSENEGGRPPLAFLADPDRFILTMAEYYVRTGTPIRLAVQAADVMVGQESTVRPPDNEIAGMVGANFGPPAKAPRLPEHRWQYLRQKRAKWRKLAFAERSPEFVFVESSIVALEIVFTPRAMIAVPELFQSAVRSLNSRGWGPYLHRFSSRLPTL